VFPGKRMEGRMGGDRVFARNLQVYRIDTRYNIVFVTGCVPGAKKVGGWVQIGEGVVLDVFDHTSQHACLPSRLGPPARAPFSLW
jgi:hypothetical protein